MKSKRLIGALVAVVMTASCTAALTACNNDDDGHSHSWGYVDVGGGYHRQQCSCGAVKEDTPKIHRDLDGNHFCDDCNADLTQVVAVSSVTLDKTAETLTVGGGSLTLAATVNPVGAATVLWSSSDPTVATVEGGVVTAIKAGIATITATAGNKSATCKVTVNAATPAQPVEMDAEKWAAAFTFGDKVGATSYMATSQGESVMTLKFDGKKAYYGLTRGGITKVLYFEEAADGKVYDYYKDYEYWTKEENGDYDSISSMKGDSLTLGLMFPFDKFEKNADVNGEYVAKEAYQLTLSGIGGDVDVNMTSAKMRFDANGKLVSAEYVESGDRFFVTLDYNPTVTLPKALESDEIATDADWNAALQMKDKNYRAGVNSYDMLVNEFMADGDIKKTTYGSFGMGGITYNDTYYSKEGGAIYEYSVDGERVSKKASQMTVEQFDAYNAFTFFEKDPAQFQKQYFTFDAENKMYVMENGDLKVCVKFKNGKLFWASYANSSTSENWTVDFVFGDTQIELPAVTVAAGQEVSDSEWTSAVAMNENNIEIEMDVMYGSYKVSEIVYKKVGDVLYQKVTDSERVTELYTVKDGSKYFGYYVAGGKWVKEEIEEKDFNEYLPASMLGTLNKADFTYNSSSQTYTGQSENGISEIKFVNKKVDYIEKVGSAVNKMYFSYGSAVLTVPNAGDAAESDDLPGGGGGGVEVKPSQNIDISEDQWRALFENVANSSLLTVYCKTESPVRYMVNDEEGFILADIAEGGAQVVLATADEGIWQYIFEEETGDVTKAVTEYNTLSQAKQAMFDDIFAVDGIGNLFELYSLFEGANGHYGYNSGEVSVEVTLQEGALSQIIISSSQSDGQILIQYEAGQAPEWYTHYLQENSQA